MDPARDPRWLRRGEKPSRPDSRTSAMSLSTISEPYA